MKIDGSRRSLRAVALLGAAAVVLTACSSQGGAPASSGGAAAGGGGDTSGANLTFQMITHEQAGDTFWDKIRAGAQDAAKAHGITLQYSNN
jgi:simple sugar transport system substrate-binding protein